ncbi:MAG TPA: c-type cytochrome [Thermoanaerobaculia bacterium]|nr:c-type cytochrome [Thermoanaerobaculia bacterium]
MRRAVLLCSLLLSCTAVQQQKSQPPATDDLHFHNLQVLPQNIPRDDLLRTMERFTQALGVECDYCHVPNPAGTDPEFDFPSDAKREKAAARVMLLMTRRINRDYVSRIPDAHTTVTCWTCHRGQVQPAIVPSLSRLSS